MTTYAPWEVQNLILSRPDVADRLRNAAPEEVDGILEKAMGHRHVTINILGAQPEDDEEHEEHEESKGRKERKRKGEGEQLVKEQQPVAPPRDLPTLNLDAPASPDATPPPVQPGPTPGPSPQIPLFVPPNARGAQNNPPAGLSKAESELASSFEPLCKAANVEPLPQPKPFPLPGKTTSGNAAKQPGKSEDAQQVPDEQQFDPSLYEAYMGGGGPVVVDRSTDRRIADRLAAEKAAKQR